MSDIPALRHYFYPVAYTHEVADTPVARTVLGTDIVVWRPPGDATVRAAVDGCPHRAARLSQGWLAGDCLVCPYHGWAFASDHRCTLIPANGPGAAIPPGAVLDAVAVTERCGLVWICPGQPFNDVPVLEGAEPDSGCTLIHELMDPWQASAPQVMDNALDVSSIPWLQRNTVGSPDHSGVSPFSVQRDGLRLRFILTCTAAMSIEQIVNPGINTGITAERITHVEMVQPFVYRGVLEYPANGLRHVLFKTATPIDDHTTLLCEFIARNDNPPPERWEAIAGVDRSVQAEDAALLAGVPSPFPLDTNSGVHVAADRMTVEYRRIPAELAEQ